MTPTLVADRRLTAYARPTYHWEPARGPHVHALRLHGTLSSKELRRVADALLERGRSPRDLVTIDFEQVDHLDYRALPEFAAALSRQRDRGALIWLIGLSAYVRRLFDVAGQGPTLRRLEWNPEGAETTARRLPLDLDSRVTPPEGCADRATWQ